MAERYAVAERLLLWAADNPEWETGIAARQVHRGRWQARVYIISQLHRGRSRKEY